MISKKDAQKIKYFCKCGKALPCLNCLNDDETKPKPKPKHKNQIEPSFYSAWALAFEFDQGMQMLHKYDWEGAGINDLPTKVFRTRQQARDARRSCRFKKAKVVKVIISIESLESLK